MLLLGHGSAECNESNHDGNGRGDFCLLFYNTLYCEIEPEAIVSFDTLVARKAADSITALTN